MSIQPSAMTQTKDNAIVEVEALTFLATNCMGRQSCMLTLRDNWPQGIIHVQQPVGLGNPLEVSQRGKSERNMASDMRSNKKVATKPQSSHKAAGSQYSAATFKQNDMTSELKSRRLQASQILDTLQTVPQGLSNGLQQTVLQARLQFGQSPAVSSAPILRCQKCSTYIA